MRLLRFMTGGPYRYPKKKFMSSDSFIKVPPICQQENHRIYPVARNRVLTMPTRAPFVTQFFITRFPNPLPQRVPHFEVFIEHNLPHLQASKEAKKKN